jgi:flavin reductase (DIM6/NTAB) family NADH-FMN oxidoreductase RutF
VAVNRKRYLADWLTAGVPVALSLLGETQKKLLGHFGKGFEPGEPAFAGLETMQTPSGLMVLADCLGWLEGQVAGELDAGDHQVALVQLTAAYVGPRHADERPWVHLRKNGLNY